MVILYYLFIFGIKALLLSTKNNGLQMRACNEL
uniref:Uncharacterized protein n=1 Tax=Rhizophora mucronata TaxID=61149 RepID=A0A2P2KQ52_RHIMU